MRATFKILLSFLFVLSPTTDVVGADGGLAELAASKRSSALKLAFRSETLVGGELNSFGVFISDDGLALVALGGLGFGLDPTAFAADGISLKTQGILGIFPKQNLALMKFEHRPKAPLRLAAREPEILENIALVTLKSEKSGPEILNGLKSAAPVGPVLAKRSTMNSLKVPGYSRVLSMGSKFDAHVSSINAGCFAIDDKGEIVGFLHSSNRIGKQVIVQLSPVVGLTEEVAALRDSGKTIPFPFPEADNPTDPALRDKDWSVMSQALLKGDRETSRRLHDELQKRYPSSFQLQSLAPNVGKFPVFPESTAGDEPASVRGMRLMEEANALGRKGDLEGAFRGLEAAVAAGPKDMSALRYSLAKMYLKQERYDEAERHFREAYRYAPEIIESVESYASLLYRRGRTDEGKRMSKWAYDLRDIYGW